MGKIPSNACFGGNTKQADGDAFVTLELVEILGAPSLSLLTGPLWFRVETPEKVQSTGQIEQFDISTECKQITC